MFLPLLFLALALALFFPDAFQPLTDHVEPRLTTALSLLFMAWTMPTRALAGEVARPAAALWAVAVSYGFVPLCAWLLGLACPFPDVQVGLVLIAAVPCTLSSAVLWTRLAGGNEATALFAVLGSTLTSWLLTPAWLGLTTGARVALDVPEMMLNLTLCLIVPVALGQFARAVPVLAAVADRRKALFGIAAQVLILSIVLRASVAVGLRRQAGGSTLGPAVFAWSIALAVTLHLLALGFGLASAGWLRFDRPRRLAVAFASSQKTLPVSLLLFDQYFDAAFPLAVVPLLFYHAGQFVLDTALARRLRLDKETRRQGDKETKAASGG